MVHCGDDPWSEDPARKLNNQISELQARVAFPNHWSSGEHEQNVEKLRQLSDEKTSSEWSTWPRSYGVETSLTTSPISLLALG